MSSTSGGVHQAALPALHWRALQPGDLDAVQALHQLSIAGMTPQLVKPESRAFLASLLNGRGRVFGGLAGDQLVAYGVLQHDLLAQDDPRTLFGFKPDRRAAKLAGAAVAPGWRGQGLQRLLIAKRMACVDHGTLLFATAAPGNYASWHSLLACGFAVRALEQRYGGLARYLLLYDPLAPRPVGSTALAEQQETGSLELQQALLHAGWQGVAPGNAAHTLRLVAPAGAPA